MIAVGSGAVMLCTVATDGAGASICGLASEDGAAAEDGAASAPTGRRGSPMDVPRGTNVPAEIDGISYSGHAIDEMQSEGFTPSVVKDAIYYGREAVDRSGRIAYYSQANNITVIIEDGRVVTVSSGELKIR